MRYARVLTWLGAGLAALVAGAAPLRAQTFFPESEALRPGSAVELTLSTTERTDSTANASATTFTDVDASLARLGIRLRAKVLAAGAAGEQRRFTERTDTYTQRDDRDQTSAYLGLALEGVVAKDDALYVLISGGALDEEFAYETYLRQLDTRVTLQSGIVYRLAFVIAGYLRGSEKLRLRVTDPALPTVDEDYQLDYSALLAGLEFGSPDDGGLLLLVQRKETPAVAGVAVNLEPGLEELRRAAVAWGPWRLNFVRTYSRDAFTGESQRENTEHDLSLGLQLSQSLFVSASQKRIKSRQDFTLLGVPNTSNSDRVENLLSVSLRF